MRHIMTKKYIDADTLFQIRDVMEHGNIYRYRQARIADLIQELLATDDWHLDQWLATHIRYLAKLETEIVKLNHDVNNGLSNLNDVSNRLDNLTANLIEDGSAKRQYLNNARSNNHDSN